MTVGSFTSVSLDPPLVAFLPSKTSSSWRSIRESGTRFCVNVLHADQESLCRAVATRKKDKFDGFAWRRSPGGNPVLDGGVAWIDCELTEVHDAGDHVIVLGEVRSLGLGSPGQPLLFSGAATDRSRRSRWRLLTPTCSATSASSTSPDRTWTTSRPVSGPR